MHGDFSRDSFDPKKNFTRVLMQQGRLIVDADWNEQSAIVLNYLRTLAADIIGWHGGPGVAPGFGTQYGTTPAGPFLVTVDTSNNNNVVSVSGGRYYLDGMQITEEGPIADSLIQKDNANSVPLDNKLLYLDVSECHVVAERDDSIRDDALFGLETTSRIRLVTRIRLLHTGLTENADQLQQPESVDAQKRFRDIDIKEPLSSTQKKIANRRLHETNLPKLIAWTNIVSSDQENCVKDTSTGYTGIENQLYRVEVHHAGKDGRTFWDGTELTTSDSNATEAFTLKWSRDNGSVVYAATAGDGTATLKSRWRDETRAIRAGDYVELIAESDETGSIVLVTNVREDNGVVIVDFAQPTSASPIADRPVLLRRWDHRNRKSFPVAANGGFLCRQETVTEVISSLVTSDLLEKDDKVSSIIPIEDGVFIRLILPDHCVLEAGDHWLIPARAATSDIIWPRFPEKSGPESYKPVSARYTEHHYAPIALIKSNGDIIDLRRKIDSIAK